MCISAVSVVLLLFILWMLVVQLWRQTNRKSDGDAKASNKPEGRWFDSI